MLVVSLTANFSAFDAKHANINFAEQKIRVAIQKWKPHNREILVAEIVPAHHPFLMGSVS
jgi:hypothetical protein